MANTFIFDDDDQPDAGGSMLPEPDDEQPPEEEGEGNNRNFMIILGVLGVVFFLIVLCVGGIFLYRNSTAQASLAAATNDFATQQVAAVTQTADALALIPTLAPTEEPTEAPTETQVVIIFATETPDASLPTVDPVIATAEVQQTALAQTQVASEQGQSMTATTQAKTTPGKGTPNKAAGTPSKLGQTGFADEVGLPLLAVLTVILLGVILLARRLRAVPGR